MAYAQFLAGIAFNNANSRLGYVHAMAHQLGGFYDLPHGVCNALLLPHVEAFNMGAASDKLNEVGAILQARTTRSWPAWTPWLPSRSWPISSAFRSRWRNWV